MKNFLKAFAILIILGGVGLSTAQAQNYSKAVGLRYTGIGTGITGKMFISESAAIEAVLSYRSYGGFVGYGYTGIGVMGLYEIHADLDFLDGLQYYYGGGAVFNNYSYSYDNSTYGTNYSQSNFGIAAVGGLEYKFEDYPVTISTDIIPTFTFGKAFSGLYFNGGGAIRYAF